MRSLLPASSIRIKCGRPVVVMYFCRLENYVGSLKDAPRHTHAANTYTNRRYDKLAYEVNFSCLPVVKRIFAFIPVFISDAARERYEGSSGRRWQRKWNEWRISPNSSWHLSFLSCASRYHFPEKKKLSQLCLYQFFSAFSSSISEKFFGAEEK